MLSRLVQAVPLSIRRHARGVSNASKTCCDPPGPRQRSPAPRGSTLFGPAPPF